MTSDTRIDIRRESFLAWIDGIASQKTIVGYARNGTRCPIGTFVCDSNRPDVLWVDVHTDRILVALAGGTVINVWLPDWALEFVRRIDSEGIRNRPIMAYTTRQVFADLSDETLDLIANHLVCNCEDIVRALGADDGPVSAFQPRYDRIAGEIQRTFGEACDG